MQYFQAVQAGKKRANESQMKLFDIAGFAMLTLTTKKIDGKIFTNGGRVLGVTTLGETLKDAIENAYIAYEKINCESKYFRNDIGKKGLDLF